MKLPLGALVEKYFFCDPASSKKHQEIKRTRARSAIVGVAPDPLGRIFVLYAWADRCSTDHLTEQILLVNDTYRPRVFGVEANAMQSLYGEMVSREARAKAQRLPLIPVQQPTHIDKDFRIRAAIQLVIAEGRLFLQPQHHELQAELKAFPLSPLKDLVDALASAVKLVPPRAIPRQQSEEIEALAAYLRETGAPPWHIEQRIAEVLEENLGVRGREGIGSGMMSFYR